MGNRFIAETPWPEDWCGRETRIGGHPWSLPLFIYITPGVKQEQRHFLGMPPKSLLAPALRRSPFGSQSPNYKSLGESCTSSGLHRSRGWWPQCGTVTPSSLPLRTSTATLLAHCALRWTAQHLEWMNNRFITLFSAWRGRHGQQLTPAHCSWRSNTSHSSSGAPRSLGYFAKHKRNRVTESNS